MPYDPNLAARVREYFSRKEAFQVEEKKMFGGLAFMVNGKMCINIGDNLLMCRFDPALTEQLSQRPGFLPLSMKGKQYIGYCYVDPVGYQDQDDFEFWINLCLEYNNKAAVTKKKMRKGCTRRTMLRGLTRRRLPASSIRLRDLWRQEKMHYRIF